MSRISLGSYKLKSTTGTTKQAESNKVPVKVKNELEIAIEQWEATTTYISKETIQNPALRLTYQKKAKEISNRYRQLVKDGTLKLKEAAEECNNFRNQIMETTRRRTSSAGLAAAKNMKAQGLTLEFLYEKYAYQLKDPENYKKLLKNNQLNFFIKQQMASGRSFFNSLSDFGKNRIYYSVIRSAGNANPNVTEIMKRVGALGSVFLVVTLFYAAREIYYAENKQKEAIKQTTTIISGIATGAVTASIAYSPAGAVCGAAAPICIIMAGLVGSAVGGWGAYKLLEEYDKELEEFTTWNFF